MRNTPHLAAFSLAIASVLISPPDRGARAQDLVTVPLVGCPQYGPEGARPARGGPDRRVQIPPEAAARLAYYSASPGGLGVLAPRGWSCLLVQYGSGSNQLYVAPKSVDSAKVWPSPVWVDKDGPVITLTQAPAGDTAFTIPWVAARVFPDRPEILSVSEKGQLQPPGGYARGSFPADILVRRGTSVVEYHTPAKAEGLGKYGDLGPAGEPIDGVAILGKQESPDLVLLAARLPAKDHDLSAALIAQVEAEADGVTPAQRAERGDTLQMMILADRLETSDPAASTAWLQRAMEDGQWGAAHELVWLNFKLKVPPNPFGQIRIMGSLICSAGSVDPQKGRAVLEAAAARGDGEAMSELAANILNSECFSDAPRQRAIDLYQAAARAGRLDARVWLAESYAHGLNGLPLDAKLAAYWRAQTLDIADVDYGTGMIFRLMQPGGNTSGVHCQSSGKLGTLPTLDIFIKKSVCYWP